MTQEQLDKARDNRYRASGKREIRSHAISIANDLRDITMCSGDGLKKFWIAFDFLNGFVPDIKRQTLDKMRNVLYDGLLDLAATTDKEAEELDKEFDAL